LSEDYCLNCRQPMAFLRINSKVPYVYVCGNEKCPRCGLMSVAAYKLKPKNENTGDKKIQSGNVQTSEGTSDSGHK